MVAKVGAPIGWKRGHATFGRMMRLPFLLLISCWATLLRAQPPLSDSSTVSLMTVAPGDAVYSYFGHSALRVRDPQGRLDRCYNYGTFDFDQPNFLLKFCRGKLLYMLDTEPTRAFEYGNLHDHRSMREQILRLNREQRQAIFNFLENNALPENRSYKYDFFYDNCATRIRDAVNSSLEYRLHYDTSGLQRPQTMRQLLRPYLTQHPWTQFGIDLVLGMPADRVAHAEQFMFLPDYVHDLFARASIDGSTPLVQAEHQIPEQPFPRLQMPGGLFSSPFWVMVLVAVLGLLSMGNLRLERIFDTLFWFVLGLAGLIMALLWFATDHSATKDNLNLMWALPTHLLFFWRRTRTEVTEIYFTAAAILAAIALAFWKFLPQELPLAAMPLAGLVVVKGMWRHWKKRGSTKTSSEEA